MNNFNKERNQVADNTLLNNEDEFMKTNDEICAEMDFMASTLRAMRNKDEMEIHGLKKKNTLTESIQLKGKMNEKSKISIQCQSNDELSSMLLQFLTSYPDESSNLIELQEHHTKVCFIFNEYVSRCEEEDTKYQISQREKTEGLGHGY